MKANNHLQEFIAEMKRWEREHQEGVYNYQFHTQGEEFVRPRLGSGLAFENMPVDNVYIYKDKSRFEVQIEDESDADHRVIVRWIFRNDDPMKSQNLAFVVFKDQDDGYNFERSSDESSITLRTGDRSYCTLIRQKNDSVFQEGLKSSASVDEITKTLHQWNAHQEYKKHTYLVTQEESQPHWDINPEKLLLGIREEGDAVRLEMRAGSITGNTKCQEKAITIFLAKEQGDVGSIQTSAMKCVINALTADGRICSIMRKTNNG